MKGKKYFWTSVPISLPFLIFNLLVLGGSPSYSQETGYEAIPELSPKEPSAKVSIFKGTRIINSQSTETIYKRELDFKVDHRFGDIAGSRGGISTFYGLDNSADIRIGFEYGLSDQLSVGIARLKGATRVSQLYDINLKYRVLQQTADNRVPFSLTGYASLVVPGVKADMQNDDQATSYRQFTDRLNGVVQLIWARKFNSWLSLAVHPTYIRRNTTAYYDNQSNLFAMGFGGYLKLNKSIALVIDYFLPFRTDATKKNYAEAVTDLYHPLGVGLEIETGGHIFNLNFTNATAIQEIQFVAETTTSWTKGEFRWGFTIARRFSL